MISVSLGSPLPLFVCFLPHSLPFNCYVVTSKWLGLLYDGLWRHYAASKQTEFRSTHEVYMEIANIPLEEVGGGVGGAKYPNIGSDPGSQLAAAASERVPLRIFPLMRFPDTHESYSLNGSSPFNSLYFREIGCNVNGIQIKQRS